MKQWAVSRVDKEQAIAISREHSLPMLLSMLLSIRGITNKEQIKSFLSDEISVFDPFLIKDMDKAVERIKKAIENGERICVYGDYDADGVTSTSLLYSYLYDTGADVSYYIPSREAEGYGMNKTAVEKIAYDGVTLIITVDNGISAAEEIAFASSLGIDTVVTDHHRPPEKLPDAVAVVDMHQADCNAPFKDMSGVGVAFMLVYAIEGEYADLQQLMENYADITALGTIGDIVPLQGENRVFVKQGLRYIENTDRSGISAMLDESGLTGKKLTAGSVSFTLVPRINAGGRMGLSQKSVSLLLTDDENEAREIAAELGEDNSQRQSLEKEILEKIYQAIKDNPKITYDKVIVIDGENWHQGVIGIVASRLKEAYDKPVIVLARNGSTAKGSGRSVEGFPLCDAVAYCADLLNHFGGHPMAAGLDVDCDKIEQFRRKINEYADSLSEMPCVKLKIDCKLNPAQLDVTLAQQISYMEPFGSGNPTPLFGLYNMTIQSIQPVGNGKHLKLVLNRDNSTVTAMRFSQQLNTFSFRQGDVVDLAVTLDVNNYNSKAYLSVVIKDIKLTNSDNLQMIKSQRIFEAFEIGKEISKEEAQHILPSRDDFAFVYRYIKTNGNYSGTLDNFVCRLNNNINYGKLRVIINVMNELNLAEIHTNTVFYRISLSQVSGKADLESSTIIKKLKGICVNG